MATSLCLTFHSSGQLAKPEQNCSRLAVSPAIIELLSIPRRWLTMLLTRLLTACHHFPGSQVRFRQEHRRRDCANAVALEIGASEDRKDARQLRPRRDVDRADRALTDGRAHERSACRAGRREIVGEASPSLRSGSSSAQRGAAGAEAGVFSAIVYPRFVWRRVRGSAVAARRAR
jgi:hypothetical protein